MLALSKHCLYQRNKSKNSRLLYTKLLQLALNVSFQMCPEKKRQRTNFFKNHINKSINIKANGIHIISAQL